MHPEDNINMWCPDVCPVTFRQFFCWIHHPELGLVPTYGGPFDSYTIPEPSELIEKTTITDIELCCYRFDHDEGWWTNEYHDIGLRIITENRYLYLIDKELQSNSEVKK